MLSNNLLNGGYDKKKLIAKYGSEWDNLSADQQDKLMKEDMDKQAIEKGNKIAKAKLTNSDRDIVKLLDQVEEATHWVNYTSRHNNQKRDPPTEDEKNKQN